ncbi:MAG: peptidoglycan recognition protein family protein [Planctomycetota bacterium]|jgi:hypothetical protein|nr:peptidoglycan recognition protein family protein [Planctomycetota bacterium]
MEMDGVEEGKNGGGMGRREFLLLAAAGVAGLILPGCGHAPLAYSPPETPSERRKRSPAAYASPAPYIPEQAQYVSFPAQPAESEPPVWTPAAKPAVGMTALSRNSWGASAALPEKMKPMNGVARITIHHEGSAKPNADVTRAQVAATLRLIQSQHRKRMGAGDIGYHFVIDRTGTVWQGRDWGYQGAHVSGANPHNIGIMLLGNFEIQQPTRQQLESLERLVASLARKYGLDPATKVFRHCDFGNTQCPGRNLKPHVDSMRRSLRA